MSSDLIIQEGGVFLPYPIYPSLMRCSSISSRKETSSSFDMAERGGRRGRGFREFGERVEALEDESSESLPETDKVLFLLLEAPMVKDYGEEKASWVRRELQEGKQREIERWVRSYIQINRWMDRWIESNTNIEIHKQG